MIYEVVIERLTVFGRHVQSRERYRARWRARLEAALIGRDWRLSGWGIFSKATVYCYPSPGESVQPQEVNDHG